MPVPALFGTALSLITASLSCAVLVYRAARRWPQLSLKGLQSGLQLLHRQCPHKPLLTALPLSQHPLLLLLLRKQQSSSLATGWGLCLQADCLLTPARLYRTGVLPAEKGWQRKGVTFRLFEMLPDTWRHQQR